MQNSLPQIQNLRLSSRVLLAPMAGITDLPYRRIMKSHGAGLVFSEMISANGLIREGRKTRLLLASHPEEAPLAVQLFGDDPEIMARAATLVGSETALLDINMGCPVKKVIRSGAGSALLRDPARIREILDAVRRSFAGPLTIKIRSGWDQSSLNYLEIGRIAERAGVDAITLHPRSRCQVFSGRADWSQIERLKDALQIPVFGSGDVFSPEDAVAMFEQTGCDAVMIGRGAYGNPWLISRSLDLLAGRETPPPDPAMIFRTARHHLDMHREEFGDRKTLLEMRKHLSWYARGLDGASRFRSRVQKTTTLAELYPLLEEFFTEAVVL